MDLGLDSKAYLVGGGAGSGLSLPCRWRSRVWILISTLQVEELDLDSNIYLVGGGAGSGL